jgi:tetratricopeptide (TPR) repeat protein
MGMIYYSLEDWENCERELKRSLSIEENTPYVLNLLAWMYVTVPRDSTFYRPKAAMSLARKAVSAHPHSVYIDTQARAAYADGDIQEAARLYQRNIDSKKSVRYANYGLAVCSFRQGRQKEGAEYLKTSLKLKFRDKRLIRNDMDIPEIRNNPAIKEILADKEPQGLE